MQRVLFLKSAGRDIESYKPLLPYLRRPISDNKICFITTASHQERNKDYLKGDVKAMNKIGFINIEEYDIKGKTEEKLRKDLTGFDIIFVSGGNTFYLLKQIRKSGFNSVIQDLLNRGIIYMGVSAGSYIACPTIEMANWKAQDNNLVGLKNLNAMGLIPFLIFAHFTQKLNKVVEKESRKIHYPVIALTDKQAILCINDKCKIIGVGKKNTFNNFRETL